MLDFRQNNEPIYYGADQIQQSHENQLRDIDQRHGDLRQLETDIVQLHEIHRDFAELVGSHGQVIDNIESSVVQTETHVEQSNKALSKALDLRTAVRRKRIICGAVLLIIIALIAIITTVSIVTKKK